MEAEYSVQSIVVALAFQPVIIVKMPRPPFWRCAVFPAPINKSRSAALKGRSNLAQGKRSDALGVLAPYVQALKGRDKREPDNSQTRSKVLRSAV